jgi:hypothetical protein
LELLRKAVASALSLPLASSPEELARLKLVKSGVALVDDTTVKLLKDGGKKQTGFEVYRERRRTPGKKL